MKGCQAVAFPQVVVSQKLPQKGIRKTLYCVSFAINVNGMSNDFATELATALGADYAIAITDRDWIEVNPANPLRDKLDFIRIVQDDTHWQVFHLTHNEVLKGEATFVGSMVGYLPTAVRELAEVIW